MTIAFGKGGNEKADVERQPNSFCSWQMRYVTIGYFCREVKKVKKIDNNSSLSL